MIKLANRNMQKLVTAAKKGFKAPIALMIKDGAVYSLSLRTDYMYFYKRKTLLTKARARNDDLGVFQLGPEELCIDFVRRLHDELVTAGAELPELPDDQGLYDFFKS